MTSIKEYAAVSAKRFRVVFAVVLLVFCTDSKLPVDELNALKNDPARLDQFEQKHGKIGAYALPALLLRASRFLDRPMGELEALIRANAEIVMLTPLRVRKLRRVGAMAMFDDIFHRPVRAAIFSPPRALRPRLRPKTISGQARPSRFFAGEFCRNVTQTNIALQDVVGINVRLRIS
ncbi:MAG: hypothetical protein AB8G17_19230 [Gammaproteobacteria bacterium]